MNPIDIKSYNLFLFKVSISGELDSTAKTELEKIHKSRSIAENELIEKSLYDTFQCPRQDDASRTTNWTYAKSIYSVILQICDKLELCEDFPVTVNDAKRIHIGIRKAIEYGLKPFLLAVTSSTDMYLPYIVANVNILRKISNYKYFAMICTRSDQHLLYTDLVSSIFTVLCFGGDAMKSEFEIHLKNIQDKISHTDYFKILFLIQGNNKSHLALLIQPIAHKQLMQCLYRPGSFAALCEALLPSITSLDQDEEIVKKRLHCCAVISAIIARRGYSKQFYHTIIDEIHRHLLGFIQSNKSHQLYYVDVGVQCLSKLCSLQLKFIDRHIIDIILGLFNRLATPPDLLVGAIVCESNAFLEAIHLVHLTFCASGPTDVTLPSELLVPYVPLFIQLHSIFVESTNKLLKNEILAIIVRCLSNREVDDLNKIIDSVLYEEYESDEKCLHPRVQIEYNIMNENELITLKIRSNEADQTMDANNMDFSSFLRSSTTLVNVLKQCNHNMLIYNVFLHLLQMFSEIFGTTTSEPTCSSELLGDADELSDAIEKKFKRKYAMIHALNELILFKQFHGQFAENPHDIIEMLDKMLNRQIEQIETKKIPQQSENEEVLIVILSIVGDFLQRIQKDELKTRLEQTLTKLRSILRGSQMNNVLRKLDFILDSGTTQNESSEFLVAKAILSETHSEPYTKVYGIMNMIKLIQAKDEETRLNAHIVLALSMKMLREEDSYIFLNCIKLLISLVELLEDTVLDTLIAEYHFDIDSDVADIDFKLKVGETIVKVTQGLGAMCYKYKSILVNCFLRGAYNRNDEFRTSNMSNLGVIIKFLSYQVHHFFQEVRKYNFLFSFSK